MASRACLAPRGANPTRVAASIAVMGSRHDGVVRHSSVARVPRPCARRPRKRRRGRVYVKRRVEPAQERSTRTRSSLHPTISVLRRTEPRNSRVETNGARRVLGPLASQPSTELPSGVSSPPYGATRRKASRRRRVGPNPAYVFRASASDDDDRAVGAATIPQHPRRGTSEVGVLWERLLQPREKRACAGGRSPDGDAMRPARGAPEPIARSGAR